MAGKVRGNYRRRQQERCNDSNLDHWRGGRWNHERLHKRSEDDLQIPKNNITAERMRG